MPDSPATAEQLRRQKHTVIGAGHRLSQIARSYELHPGEASELASITRELEDAAGRLERLLAALRRDR